MIDQTENELTLQRSPNVPMTATINLGRKQVFKREVGECSSLLLTGERCSNRIEIEIVTISSYERSSSALRLVFIEFLQTTGHSSHARHAYIYPAERERDKREKRRCNNGKGDSSSRRYEHNEDGTYRLHHDG
jgi:hypothetical protein